MTLKGGLALELRFANARSTKGVDLRMVGDPDAVLSRLREAAALNLGDHLTFTVEPDWRQSSGSDRARRELFMAHGRDFFARRGVRVERASDRPGSQITMRASGPPSSMRGVSMALLRWIPAPPHTPHDRRPALCDDCLQRWPAAGGESRAAAQDGGIEGLVA